MMKKLMIIPIFFILSLVSANAQEPIFEELRDSAIAHYDTLKMYYGDLHGLGYGELKRKIAFWEERLTIGGKLSEASEAYVEHYQQQNTTSSSFALQGSCNSSLWEEIGPIDFPAVGNDSYSYQAGLGIVNKAVFHPDYGINNNKTIYIVASGGFYKTTDDGFNWTNMLPVDFDRVECSDVAIGHQSDDNIYLAVGDNYIEDLKSPRHTALGIYISEDGGNTWEFSGPEASPWSFTNGEEFIKISKVITHPLDDDVAYVLTFKNSWSSLESKVYKTIDGGDTWHNIYQTNEKLSDLEFHPTNHDIIYLSSGYTIKRITDNINSTNLITNPIDVTPSNLITYANNVLREIALIEIEVSLDAPDNFYVTALALETSDQLPSSSGIQNFWVSNNKGDTYTTINPIFPSGNYNTILQAKNNMLGFDVSNTNANSIFISGVAASRCDDFNTNPVHFTSLTNTNISSSHDIHPDNRDIVVSPISDSIIVSCNDACFYISYDKGDTWESRCSGLGIARIRAFSISKTPNETDDDIILAGFQDCNSAYINLSDGSNQWIRGGNTCGDGFDCQIDYENNEIFYATCNKRLQKSINGGGYFNDVITSSASSKRYFQPILLDPNNHEIVYFGKNQLIKIDGVSQSVISTYPYLSEEQYITSFDIAKSDSYIIYSAWSPNGAVYYNNGWNSNVPEILYVTKNGGTTWDDITPNQDYTANGGDNFTNVVQIIKSILIHPENPDKVWITYSGFRTGNSGWQVRKVAYTEDGGITWHDYSEGLSAIPVNKIMLNENRLFDEELYIATDVGIYYRNKYHSSWKKYDYLLPDIFVNDIDINQHKKIIRAATYGRGIWESNLHCPCNNIDYDLSGNLSSNYYETNSTISSTVTIPIDNTIAYRATESITMNPGFSAVPNNGNDFSACLYSCTPYNKNRLPNTNDAIPNDLEKEQVFQKEFRDVIFQVFPNPTNDIINVNFNMNLDNIDLNLYNTNGVLIKNLIRSNSVIKDETQTFNISKITTGTYYLTLFHNGLKNSQKIIIQ